MSDTPKAVPIEILLRERPWVRALARSLVLDENDADDLEQKAWLAAIEGPPAEDRSPRGWLATVLRRALARRRRGERRRDSRERVAARPESTADTADLASIAEQHRRLVGLVLELDEPYRGALLARYFEGRAPREIAATRGVPVSTVGSWLTRGLALLRERLDHETNGDRRAWCTALAPIAGLTRADGPASTPTTGTPAAGGGRRAHVRASGGSTARFVVDATSVSIAALAAILVAGGAWWFLRDRPTGERELKQDGTTHARNGDAKQPGLAPTPRKTSSDLPERAESNTPPPSTVGPALGVHVHVVEKFGRTPIAGAEVTTFFPKIVLGTTDANGDVTVDVPSERSRPPAFRVHHDDYIESYGSAASGETRTILLARIGPIVGRVIVAPGDKPAVGARVLAFKEEVTQGDALEATTDAAGRFTIRGDIVSAGTVDLVVRADGRATVVVEAVPFGRRDETVIRLEDGGGVEGTVTDVAGQPIAGAAVTLLEEDEALPSRRAPDDKDIFVQRRFESVDRVISDPTGHYAIEGVRLGATFVAIAATESSALVMGRSETFTLSRVGERVLRDVRVPTSGSLRVSIDGIPEEVASTARISIFAPGIAAEASGADRWTKGAFVFEKLTPGRYDVRADREGTPTIGGSIDVAAGRVAELHLVPRGTLAVEGVVVMPDGTPAPKAQVRWRGAMVATTQADDDGIFRFEGLDARPGSIEVEPEPLQQKSVGTTVVANVAPGGARLRITLTPMAMLHIRVAGPPMRRNWGTVQLFARGERRARTTFAETRDEDGSVNLPVDAYGVPLRAYLRPSRRAAVAIDVAPMSPAETREIVIPEPDEGRTLTVRVTDPDGKPVASAEVWLTEAWSFVDRARADASGSVTFEHVLAAPIALAVLVPHRSPSRFVAPAISSGPIQLRLEPEGTLVVRVTQRDGSPAPRALVLPLPPDDDPFEADQPIDESTWLGYVANGAGTVTKRVQARAYRLLVKDGLGERETRHGPVTVRPGETTAVDVRLP